MAPKCAAYRGYPIRFVHHREHLNRFVTTHKEGPYICAGHSFILGSLPSLRHGLSPVLQYLDYER